MPAIHDRQTGGSIYNRRVLEYLAKWMPVRLHLETPGAADGLWLVDSLCLERWAGGTGVLIAHYLEIIDPRQCNSARAAAESTLVRRYRAVVTTSHFAARALGAAGYTGQVAAIPPGLAPDYRTPAPDRKAAKQVAIVTIASIVPDKGLMAMFDALIELAEPDWTWEVIGDDTLDSAFAAAFRDRVARSPLCDRITLRGALPADELIAIYDRSDLFALPSRFETCSMATMEAMARGLPVAAFQVGGLPDLLPEISRSALVAPGDATGWARLLRRLVEGPDDRRRLGEENRRASVAFPSWEDSALALDRLLRSLSLQSK
jgi:glycosyltransferase involved in cell wall biosynthesis